MSNFNWGKGLFTAITIFIIAVLCVVGYLLSLNFDMVSNDHYQKAVTYQQQINREQHARTMEKPVEIKLVGGKIEIQFPEKMALHQPAGSITLYRPDNSSLDQKLKLSLNEGAQHIDVRNLKRGKWLVKLNWQTENRQYFKEKNIFI